MTKISEHIVYAYAQYVTELIENNQKPSDYSNTYTSNSIVHNKHTFYSKQVDIRISTVRTWGGLFIAIKGL